MSTVTYGLRTAKQALLNLFAAFLLVPATTCTMERTPWMDQQNRVPLSSFETATNFLFENGVDALNIALAAGPKQVVPQLVEKNSMTLAYRAVARLLGIHRPNHKNLLSWFLGQGGVGYRFFKQIGSQTNHWLPLFLVKYLGPAFVKRAVTGLVYYAIVNGSGLDVPQGIKRWPFIHLFLLTNLQMLAHTVLDGVYHAGIAYAEQPTGTVAS